VSSVEQQPPQFIRANGIDLAVREAGEGPAILLLHGFPELSYSWRSQMKALSAAGWRAIAPDLRGYGDTGPHGELDAYSMRNLALDMIGLIAALELDRVVLLGHDFGGALAWTIARDHPDRVAGVISLNTPYTRRGPHDLAESMRLHRGENNYMVQFQKPGVGEALLERDIAATFGRLMRRPALTLAHFNTAEPRLRELPMTLFVGEPALMGAPVMSEAELRVYINAFKRTGFTGGLNWYRNFHRNWQDTAETDDFVRAPALMVSAADDFFLPPSTTRGMEQHVPDLERHVVADCGHWIQYERPQETNAIILEWLRRRMQLDQHR
jgi:pimeloyl-ACP methyl ester carboxylesterase